MAYQTREMMLAEISDLRQHVDDLQKELEGMQSHYEERLELMAKDHMMDKEAQNKKMNDMVEQYSKTIINFQKDLEVYKAVSEERKITVDRLFHVLAIEAGSVDVMFNDEVDEAEEV